MMMNQSRFVYIFHAYAFHKVGWWSKTLPFWMFFTAIVVAFKDFSLNSQPPRVDAMIHKPNRFFVVLYSNRKCKKSVSQTFKASIKLQNTMLTWMMSQLFLAQAFQDRFCPYRSHYIRSEGLGLPMIFPFIFLRLPGSQSQLSTSFSCLAHFEKKSRLLCRPWMPIVTMQTVSTLSKNLVVILKSNETKVSGQV